MGCVMVSTKWCLIHLSGSESPRCPLSALQVTPRRTLSRGHVISRSTIPGWLNVLVFLILAPCHQCKGKETSQQQNRWRWSFFTYRGKCTALCLGSVGTWINWSVWWIWTLCTAMSLSSVCLFLWGRKKVDARLLLYLSGLKELVYKLKAICQ